MGYYDEVFRVKCGECETSYILKRQPPTEKWDWKYKQCPTRNWHSGFQPLQPNIPTELWIGHDRRSQVKLYPVSPEMGDRQWALPFSLRSFVYQVSHELRGCDYGADYRGEVMGRPTFSDWCGDWSPKSYASWEVPEDNG